MVLRRTSFPVEETYFLVPLPRIVWPIAILSVNKRTGCSIARPWRRRCKCRCQKSRESSVALFRCAVADFAAYRVSSAGALYFDARLGQSTASHWRVQLSRRCGVSRVGSGSYKRFCRHYSFRHWMGAHCSGMRAVLLFAFSVNRQRPPN